MVVDSAAAEVEVEVTVAAVVTEAAAVVASLMAARLLLTDSQYTNSSLTAVEVTRLLRSTAHPHPKVRIYHFLFCDPVLWN